MDSSRILPILSYIDMKLVCNGAPIYLSFKLTILGTPAEEGFGGKIDLINAGAFQDIDVAMMSHPFPENDPTPIMLAREK